MTELMSDLVRELEREDGYGVHEDGGGVRLAMSDGALVVSSAAGNYVVTTVDRGVVEGIDLETTSGEALDRYLLLVVGAQWRDRRGLTAFRPAPAAAQGRPTPEVVGGRWRLRWRASAADPHDVVEEQATLAWEADAEDLARVLATPLDDLAASVRHPQEHPAGTRAAAADVDVVVASYKDVAGAPLFTAR